MPPRTKGRTPATCHPERPVASHGLCGACAKVKWRQDNPELHRKSQRAHKLYGRYGLSIAEYDAILASQGGGCKICGRVANGMALHVDHDHYTERNRGILCGPCNQAIGLLGESPDRVLDAYEYLSQHVTYSVAGVN